MWQPVSFAALKRLLNGGVQGFIRSLPQISAGGSDIAPTTQPTPRPSLPPLSEPLLHARAIRLHNREPRAIAQYMQTHLNLHRER